jgi:hypothetical protein
MSSCILSIRASHAGGGAAGGGAAGGGAVGVGAVGGAARGLVVVPKVTKYFTYLHGSWEGVRDERVRQRSEQTQKEELK